jgi:tRNA pseudouridine38-40 synthase
MAEGAKHLLGRHDFRSFETDWPNRLDSVRTIVDSRLFRLGVDDQTPTSTRRRSNDGPTNGPIRFEVTADGFLYNMVRAMVGSLVEVGRGKHTPGWIREILEAKDRSSAGPTAPPHGLFLVSVDYER